MSCIICLIREWAILGRPLFLGPVKKKVASELHSKFGEENWQIGHLFNGEILSWDSVLPHIEQSYRLFFENSPEILDWLLFTAKDIFETAPSNIHSGLDYNIQETPHKHYVDIAIRRVLKELGCEFQGESLLQIRGEESDGFILSAEQVPFYQPERILRPPLKGRWEKRSIASFWHSNRVLAVNVDALQKLGKNTVGIVVRKDIRMGKGKFCAQAAHALVTLLEQNKLKWNFHSEPVEIWLLSSEERLLSLYHEARRLKLGCSLIRDAGKTQLQPGTFTAVGLGVLNEVTFDKFMLTYNARPLETKIRAYCSFEHFHLSSFTQM